MEHTLTEEEVRVMYQEKQREPFPRNKNLMGILIATVFFVGVFALYVLFLWLLIQLFGVNSMPDDVITTAIN